jgi:hypothetical protein
MTPSFKAAFLMGQGRGLRAAAEAVSLLIGLDHGDVAQSVCLSLLKAAEDCEAQAMETVTGLSFPDQLVGATISEETGGT